MQLTASLCLFAILSCHSCNVKTTIPNIHPAPGNDVMSTDTWNCRHRTSSLFYFKTLLLGLNVPV